ncbi:SprT family zinc-dependent metalloprotease [Agarivorans gilvus]|uniref:Protein SprT n=1 Tax=Agarivorans gilvus TaxID=680279 RepID=A0ABQ1HXW2_9ALTE|nr:SprT family zinc-dependent metalloprotease [Agarivorans gilvus]GGA97149.1 protein SprT [Agarivorans gilvus]
MQQLQHRVEQCFLLSEQYFKQPFARPEIVLSQRLSKVAGSANLSQWRLRFNAHFYAQDCEDFLRHTVPHEVAHLICHALYGRVKPHGKEWQSIMLKVFNCPPHTTHRYSLSEMPMKSFTYQCACQQHQLGIRRHNKVLQGAQYCCKQCRQRLIFQHNS